MKSKIHENKKNKFAYLSKKHLFIISLLIYSICNAQNGTLDTTFGNNGYADYDFGTAYFSPEYLVEQTDGKFLMSGTNNVGQGQIIVIRYLENGAIDNSYGVNGRASFGNTFVGGISSTYKMILQTDGKLLLWGSCSIGSDLLLRFNQNGSIDTTFAQNGYYLINNPNQSSVLDFIIQNNDKILLSNNCGLGCSYLPFIKRLNNNGTIDNSFGINGIIQTPAFANVGAFKLISQQDGKFIAIIYEFNNYVIKRFNNDGSLDTTYLGNGYNLNTINDTFAIILQPDGKCLVKTDDGTYGVRILRFNINGTLDASFGYNGIKSYNIPNNAFGSGYFLVLQTDGKILVSGTYNDVANSFVQMAMLRFNANGSIDNTFGNNGLVFIRNNDQYDNSLDSLLFLQSGKILHACMYRYGSTNPINPYESFTGFERFNSGVQLSNEKFEVNKTVGVSPNPSDGIFTLDLKNNEEEFDELAVYNILGQQVLFKKVNNKSLNEIDLSNFSQGIYLLQLRNEMVFIDYKLIKN